ncbi:MAG TPA: M3 family oligoendopeptidase, partial [Chitinophagaceae bacterium]|nr:M3 family oligoendopeptidase [Chitinophagaceae bacterium]
MYNAHIEKLSRQFLPEDFRIQTFNDLKPFYEQLLSFEINHVQDLVQWLKQWSELQSVISEDICWRQIKMTCDTENKKLEEAFHFFCLEIEPLIKPFHDQLNRKLLSCKYLPELNSEEYMPFIRSVKNEVELFREENVPLHAELNVLAQQYGTLTGKMTIEFQNKELTL